MLVSSNKIHSVRFRVMLNLGLTILLFFLGYLVFQIILTKKNDIINQIQKQELSESINFVLQNQNDYVEKTIYNYAIFSWLVDYIRKPNPIEARNYISEPEPIGFNFIQVYNLENNLVYKSTTPNLLDSIFIPTEVMNSLYLTRKCSFFRVTKYGLFEIWGSTVHPSNDIRKEGAPQGYIFFGKLWSKEFLTELKRSTNCDIALYIKKFNYSMHIPGATEFYLRDYRARRVALLVIQKNNPFLTDLRDINIYLNLFFIVFCLMLLIISYRTYNTLVLGPLTQIATSLKAEKAYRMKPMIGKDDEFGRIAKLLVRFFKQQQILKTNVDELNANQRTMRQLNGELSMQKQEIEEQNDKLQSLYRDLQAQNKDIQDYAEATLRASKEITDSMKYASFIQNAVLAPSHHLSMIFPEHFIFYRPKNIVSGDFYWFKAMKNGNSLLTVADCTGHGLPGALLSMLGVSFLNEISSQLEDEEFSAGTILDYLRIHLIESLHQDDESDVQDGMNIALCIFDKDLKTMQYSAAFSSVFLLRHNPETGKAELKEYEGNRAPVGIYRTNDTFDNHMVEVQKNDIIYLFSDGVLDQFGGATNKKFRLANFRKLLITIADLPLDKQKEKLVVEFDDWKGPNEQTDDVLVIGVRIK
jgi:serine phosphatase RsbU (regulator of sigma subunit)